MNSHFLAKFILLVSLFLWPLNILVSNRFHLFPPSQPSTIFVSDYQAKQLVLRNTYLYPNVFLARLFQNKAKIVVDKFENNLFSLLDPNYYFFSSHPREMYHNQNLVKLPFMLFFLAVLGFLNLKSLKKHHVILISFFALIVLLSCLQSFDRYDLILWPFFLIFSFHGLLILSQKYSKFVNPFLVLLVVNTCLEYFRIYLK